MPLNAISRVIGRGGSNINAIRGATGAHIEVEKQSKGQGERIITLKGSTEATKHAHSLIATLIKDPDVDILQMLPKTNKSSSSSTTLWDKTQLGTKKIAVKALNTSQSTITTSTAQLKTTVVTTSIATTRPTPSVKSRGTSSTTLRATAPRLADRSGAVTVSQSALNTKASAMATSSTGVATGRHATKAVTTIATLTFAAKLTETTNSMPLLTTSTSSSHGFKAKTTSYTLNVAQSMAGPVSPQAQVS